MAEFEAAPDGFGRRHYEFVASVLRPRIERERAADGGFRVPATSSVARDFADAFESGNPRFDRARFLKACGVES